MPHGRAGAGYAPRMHRAVLTLSVVVLAAASSGTWAQVYRCGASRVYTDKPCNGARDVDVRPNILDAGTRVIPADPPPAPAVIPPNRYDPPKVGGDSGSIWDRRDAADSALRSRTGPRTY